MEKKTRVPLAGKQVDAIELGFKAIREEWNEYQVSDGSTIRVKLVVTNICRTNEYDNDGNPIYVVRSSNVLSVSPPENLKKGSMVS